MPPSKVSPSGSYKLSGRTVNALIDAAQHVAFDRFDGAGAGSSTISPSIIRVKNGSGVAIARHRAVRFGAPIILPATNETSFLQEVLLNGLAPTPSTINGIALEPIPVNEIGRVLAPGVMTHARVNLSDNLTYKLARASSTTTLLNAIATDDIEEGDKLFEIVWHETGPGEKWAVLLLPGIVRQGVTVLGPCGVYNPAAELEDSAFDVAFGGCLWPSRYGLAYNNLAGGSSVWRNLELESVGGTLLYSSNEFSHQCFIGSITVYLQLEFSSRNAGDGEIRFVRASDDVVVAWAENRFFRWSPLKGGRMQFQDSICSCASFPQELCLSPPSR